jgi:hypothetical protein
VAHTCLLLLLLLLACAGAVAASAQLLVRSKDMDVCVRGLMALGMLLPADSAAPQQLLEAPGALQQLLMMLKQSEDMDCRVIARDLLGVLTQDPGRKAAVEQFVRQQLQARAAGP